jgi:hypothetical protein
MHFQFFRFNLFQRFDRLAALTKYPLIEQGGPGANARPAKKENTNHERF